LFVRCMTCGKCYIWFYRFRFGHSVGWCCKSFILWGVLSYSKIASRIINAIKHLTKRKINTTTTTTKILKIIFQYILLGKNSLTSASRCLHAWLHQSQIAWNNFRHVQCTTEIIRFLSFGND
jgi:hypothetical protein